MRTRGEGGFTIVELLIVILVTSVIAGAAFLMITTTYEAERFTHDMRTVMDDGRISIDRVRKDIRGARSVLAGSDAATLHFWVDQNQDHVVQTDENVWYCVRPIGGTTCANPSSWSGDAWELVRWTESPTTWKEGDALPRTSPASGHVAARTLLDPLVFTYLVGAATATDPAESQVVGVKFRLDAQTARGPGELAVSASVRLRNVE